MPSAWLLVLNYPESRTRANAGYEKIANIRKKTIEEWKGKAVMLVDSAESFDHNVEAGQVKAMLISSAPAVQRLQIRGCLLF